MVTLTPTPIVIPLETEFISPMATPTATIIADPTEITPTPTLVNDNQNLTNVFLMITVGLLAIILLVQNWPSKNREE